MQAALARSEGRCELLTAEGVELSRQVAALREAKLAVESTRRKTMQAELQHQEQQQTLLQQQLGEARAREHALTGPQILKRQ
jgi:hypothetical protein